MIKIIKRIMIGIICLCLLIVLIIGIKMYVNKKFIKEYPNTKQEYRLIFLSIFNFYEPYVADYNYGNYLYKDGRYEEAEEKYLKALRSDAPRSKICDIEVNLGLTYIELSKNVEINNEIEYLKKAKNHFNRCANMDLDDLIKEEKSQNIENGQQQGENGQQQGENGQQQGENGQQQGQNGQQQGENGQQQGENGQQQGEGQDDTGEQNNQSGESNLERIQQNAGKLSTELSEQIVSLEKNSNSINTDTAGQPVNDSNPQQNRNTDLPSERDMNTLSERNAKASEERELSQSKATFGNTGGYGSNSGIYDGTPCTNQCW